MKKRIVVFLCALLVFRGILPTGASGAAGSQLAVIVNVNSSLGSIAIPDLKDYYTKAVRLWPDNRPVIPLDRNEGSPEYHVFVERVHGKSEREMAIFWIRQKSVTGNSAPRQLTSDELMILTVGSLDGTVGYVNAASLDAEALKKVKVAARIHE